MRAVVIVVIAWYFITAKYEIQDGGQRIDGISFFSCIKMRLDDKGKCVPETSIADAVKSAIGE